MTSPLCTSKKKVSKRRNNTSTKITQWPEDDADPGKSGSGGFRRMVKHIMHHQHEAPNKPRNLDDYFTNHQILCKISTQKFMDVNQKIDRMISCLKGDAYPGTNETLADVV